MKRLVLAASIVVSLLAGVLGYRPRKPGQPKLAVPKLVAGALSGYIAAAGALAAFLSAAYRLPVGLVLGAVGAAGVRNYLRDVTSPHREFEDAFGAGWQGRIPSKIAPRMLGRRWNWWFRTPIEPRWQRNVPYGIIRGTDRHLLCDIWQPPEGVSSSGLGLVYLHGGYWHYFDKDSGTRPLFRHLAAQGHLVMDVSYRLCPEVDLAGMMEDVTRAVAWVKQRAGDYGVDPERVVVAGGSAGAHLAMLAAYAPGHPAWTPEDLRGSDLSVRGLVSYYGPPDLRPVQVGPDASLAERHLARKTPRVQAEDGGLLDQIEFIRRARARMARRSHDQMMVNLLGGLYREVPDTYALASPITHVHPGCPPTIMFQGEHDSLVSVESARALRERLLSAGVPVIYIEYPGTEHAFDLVLPHVSPPAQSSIYDLDRFLGLMAG